MFRQDICTVWRMSLLWLPRPQQLYGSVPVVLISVKRYIMLTGFLFEILRKDLSFIFFISRALCSTYRCFFITHESICLKRPKISSWKYYSALAMVLAWTFFKLILSLWQYLYIVIRDILSTVQIRFLLSLLKILTLIALFKFWSLFNSHGFTYCAL